MGYSILAQKEGDSGLPLERGRFVPITNDANERFRRGLEATLSVLYIIF